MDAREKFQILTRIESVNKSKMRIRNEVPFKARRLWQAAVAATLLKLAEAMTESAALDAFLEWSMLKSVLVKPVNAGKSRRSSSLKLLIRLLELWISGERDECWKKAKTVEAKRARQNARKQRRRCFKKGKKKGDRPRRSHSKKHSRAAELVGMGELSKAMKALTSHGVAPITDAVISQLQDKHPGRKMPVAWPTMDEVTRERKRVREEEESGSEQARRQDREQLQVEPDLLDRESKIKQQAELEINSHVPHILMNPDTIESAALEAKKSSSGGLDQITPWLLRRAVETGLNHRVAIIIARIATRWGKGDFSPVVGELAAGGRLIGLYKNEAKTDIRPIVVGSALRRLICKAFAREVRNKLHALVSNHQLGVLQGGYEVGVHTMRKLVEQCKESGEVIMVLDFKNAFNSCDRNLMLQLVAAHVPELARLVQWLYQNESHLVTSRGDTVLSSSGTQQGCALSNILFALVMQYLHLNTGSLGLRRDMCYWDDAVLVGEVDAVAAVSQMLSELESKTGLRLNWKKSHLYIGDKDPARSKTMFNRNLQIHSSFNVEFLRVPIGEDSFVKKALEKKLEELEGIIESTASMMQKHEAFALLQKCGAECRIVHLMRTLPPRQAQPFVEKFDKLLRHGFEKLVGTPVVTKWWRQAKLPSKFGGLALRSGLSTLGAQHFVSVTKAWDHVVRMCNVRAEDAEGTLKEYCDRELKNWLQRQLGQEVDMAMLIANEGEVEVQGEETLDCLGPNTTQKLSLAQVCELKEKQRVHELMDADERIHIEARSGNTQYWVKQAPLKFMGWQLEPEEWSTSARRRLRLDVAPLEKSCPCCSYGWCDKKGNHALICAGLGSTRLRHDAVRDLLRKEIQDCGYATAIEHDGGLDGKRRPGDIIIFNFNGGKHLLIDVAVVDATSECHLNELLAGGAGAAATAYEDRKRAKYEDLDTSKYDFLPFVLETSGGFGEEALEFVRKLQRTKNAKQCYVTEEANPLNNNKLLISISLEIERSNSRSILERLPQSEKLFVEKFAKCQVMVEETRKRVLDSMAERNATQNQHDSFTTELSLASAIKQVSLGDGGAIFEPDPDDEDISLGATMEVKKKHIRDPLPKPPDPGPRREISTTENDNEAVVDEEEKCNEWNPPRVERNSCEEQRAMAKITNQITSQASLSHQEFPESGAKAGIYPGIVAAKRMKRAEHIFQL